MAYGQLEKFRVWKLSHDRDKRSINLIAKVRSGFFFE